MKINLLNPAKLALMFTIALIGFTQCKKDAHQPPAVSFKTGTGFVSKDTTLAQGTTFNIGVNVSKKEDELKTYNFSVSNDGGSTASIRTDNISGSEVDGFNRTESRTTRTQAGKEKYIFSITDADGNNAQLSLTVTVR